MSPYEDGAVRLGDGGEPVVSAPEPVPVEALRSGFSPRVNGESWAHVRKLAEAAAPTPPILVHRPSMRVIDGMHRLGAALRNGAKTIMVEYFDGDDEDAFLLAVRRNIAHGLPLSADDRAAAVKRIIEAHPGWSDRAIASATGISAKAVAAIRRCSTADTAQSNVRRGRDGRLRPLSAADGRLRASEIITANPRATLREVARDAGISLSTAHDVRERLRRRQDPVPPRQRAGRRPPRDDQEPPPAAQPRSTVDHAAIIASLRRDPSLRYSEAGRFLLRLLESQSMPATKWEQLASLVPAHCLPAVRVLAAEYAGRWWEFAKRLDRRPTNA